MASRRGARKYKGLKERYPEKFASEERMFSHIRRGDRIFIGTACGEPQYLVKALTKYVSSHPKAIFDAEVVHVWTLGVAPYTDSKFESNFRHNSFFVGRNTREAVNAGTADYTPISLSSVPKLFYNGLVSIDVALIQTSMPDEHGYMSLGVSVDIVKAAVKNASLVIAQMNSLMPRVYGDGFIHVDEVDYMVPYDEPVLLYGLDDDDRVADLVGSHAARLIHDGDTLQVGYGSLANAVVSHLHNKKHLGIHTELMSDGIAKLMESGAVDNSKKTINRGKTVASFCMGSAKLYKYIDNNLAIQFRTIDYTNNPLVIARHDNMTSINSAFQIDFTGQATAESIGHIFYSGIGGQTDFMRGSALARNGKTILALKSTSEDGKQSNIVPFLQQGAGVTLNRGDVHYVATEYGVCYLHGKNIRERTMDLISLAHPRFRAQLLEEAKKYNLVYPDQAFIPGSRGEYPEALEKYKTTKTSLEILLRPVKISDEPLLKDFFYSLSDDSMYHRFISLRKDMPHSRLQDFVVIDYTKQMIILALIEKEEKEEIIGVGQYHINGIIHTADVAFVVKDNHQNEGVGSELLSYLTYLAKKQGLLGFTAEVLMDNAHMFHLFNKMGFDIQKKRDKGIYELKMIFGEGLNDQ